MLTITNDPRGYRLFLNNPGTGTRGFAVIARDVPELHEAIDHYTGSGSKVHHGGKGRPRKCPLCREQSMKGG